MGLSTIDGTGRLEYLGGGRYRAIYAAATCKSPVAPDIFNCEIGVGELLMTIIPKGRSE
ncbi:MAG: hypothetical protein Q7T82_01945 [Armatimonadota bacterium]|nr:hypothetical protein [Armatimonadota bacterium]